MLYSYLSLFWRANMFKTIDFWAEVLVWVSSCRRENGRAVSLLLKSIAFVWSRDQTRKNISFQLILVNCMFCTLETPSPGRGIFFGSRAAPLFNKDNVLLLEDVALPVLHWLYLIGQEWASSWTSWASQTTFEVIQSPRAKMQGPDLNLPPHYLCLWWWNRERNSKLGDGGWHYQRW